MLWGLGQANQTRLCPTTTLEMDFGNSRSTPRLSAARGWSIKSWIRVRWRSTALKSATRWNPSRAAIGPIEMTFHVSTARYAARSQDTVRRSSSTGVSRSSLEESGWTCLNSPPPTCRPQLAHLGFPLGRRSDRIGNLMIAGAADEVSCDLTLHRGQTLRLNVDTNDMPPAAYRATVWASHSGDEVVRQEVPVKGSHNLVELGSDVDRIGFAIYRTVDGQCVDSSDGVLVKEINIHMHLESSPTLHLYDRRGRLVQKVTPRGPDSMVNVEVRRRQRRAGQWNPATFA